MKKDVVSNMRSVLRKLEREISSQLKYELKCCGVTLAQCHLLLEVGHQKSTNTAELSQILKLDKSTLSRTVDPLVDKGFISREVNPENRRYLTLKLTEEGKKESKKIDSMCKDFYSFLFSNIPEEKHETVLEGISLLATAFELSKEKLSLDNCCCGTGGTDEKK